MAVLQFSAQENIGLIAISFTDLSAWGTPPLPARNGLSGAVSIVIDVYLLDGTHVTSPTIDVTTQVVNNTLINYQILASTINSTWTTLPQGVYYIKFSYSTYMTGGMVYVISTIASKINSLATELPTLYDKVIHKVSPYDINEAAEKMVIYYLWKAMLYSQQALAYTGTLPNPVEQQNVLRYINTYLESKNY